MNSAPKTMFWRISSAPLGVRVAYEPPVLPAPVCHRLTMSRIDYYSCTPAHLTYIPIIEEVSTWAPDINWYLDPFSDQPSH
jgi:hypothetical protein